MLSSVNIVHSIASLALSKGGPSYVLCALAGAQQPLTSGLIHIVSADTDPGTSMPVPPGIMLNDVGKSWPVRLLRARSVLKKRLCTENMILHDHGIWHPQNLVATQFARQHRVPYVISIHGMLEPWALTYHPWRKQLLRWLLQDRLVHGARCLIANSEAEVTSLRAAGCRNPVAMIANGIDMDIPTLERRSHPRKRTLLFLSRIHPKKGLIHAIEAWNVLRPHDWILRIVGPSEGGHREALESLVRGYSLTDSIEFIPAVSGVDKYQYYHDADVFLLPSLSENFGLVVPEALACGVPVITTTGTPWHELPERDCGWYIETGTAPLIATLREVLTTDSQRLREMGARGKEWVTSSFTWPSIATQNMMVYEWLLGRQSRPSFVEV